MSQYNDPEKSVKPAGGDVEETSPPAITVDLSVYDCFLEDVDLDEADREAFLKILWNIITEFVSLGFGVHPVQQAQNEGKTLASNKQKPTFACLPMVNLKHPIIEHEPVTPAITPDNFDDKSEQSREDQ